MTPLWILQMPRRPNLTTGIRYADANLRRKAILGSGMN